MAITIDSCIILTQSNSTQRISSCDRAPGLQDEFSDGGYGVYRGAILPLSQDDFNCIRQNLVDATQSFCSNSNLVAIGVGIGLGIVFMVIVITILYPYYKNQSKPIDLEKQSGETQPLLEDPSNNSINSEDTAEVTEIVDHTAGQTRFSCC